MKKSSLYNFIIFYFISYGIIFLILIDRDLHMSMGRLVLIPLFSAIPLSLLLYAGRKLPKKVMRYYKKSDYRKMKEKRSKERIKI